MASDKNSSADLADTKVTKNVTAGQGVTNASKTFWQEAYSDTQIAAQIGSKTVDSASCKPSPDYQAYVQTALGLSYSPEVFGDPRKVLHEFDCQIKTDDDAMRYANVVLARSGDSHTKVITAARNVQMNSEIAAQGTVGLGIQTTFDGSVSKPGDEHGLAVMKVFPNSSASKAGMQIGDRIVELNGASLAKLSSADALEKLTAGKVGSINHLVVERNGKNVTLDAARTAYSPVSVTDTTLPNNVAYINIGSFLDNSVPDELRASLLKHHDASAYILDLRGNGGGLVDSANKSLSLLMKDGLIMKMRERDSQDTDKVAFVNGTFALTPKGVVETDTPEDPLPGNQIVAKDGRVEFVPYSAPNIDVKERFKNLVGNKPIVVLTDSMTASAAEIFTGAIHDTGHATTIGDLTYGKGIGQAFASNGLPHGNGELVTDLRYFTPSGVWPGDAEKHKIGLKPDIAVANPFGVIPLTSGDLQLGAAENYLAARLSHKAAKK